MLQRIYSVADIAIIRLATIIVFIAFLFLIVSFKVKNIVLTQATLQGKQIVNIAYDKESYMVQFSSRLLQTLGTVLPASAIDSGMCNNFLTSYLTMNKSYLTFAVANLQGDIVCSSLPYVGTVNIKDRRYFQQAVKTGTFSLGEYQVGRITKAQSFNFGYPVKDENGKVQAVLINALSIDWFQNLIDTLYLPNNQWEFVITDYNGTVLASSNKKNIGKLGVNPTIFSHVLSASQTESNVIQDPDGKEKLYISKHLSEHKSSASLYMILTADLNKTYQKIDTIMLVSFLAISALFLLCLSRKT